MNKISGVSPKRLWTRCRLRWSVRKRSRRKKKQTVNYSRFCVATMLTIATDIWSHNSHRQVNRCPSASWNVPNFYLITKKRKKTTMCCPLSSATPFYENIIFINISDNVMDWHGFQVSFPTGTLESCVWVFFWSHEHAACRFVGSFSIFYFSSSIGFRFFFSFLIVFLVDYRQRRWGASAARSVANGVTDCVIHYCCVRPCLGCLLVPWEVCGSSKGLPGWRLDGRSWSSDFGRVVYSRYDWNDDQRFWIR